MAMEMVNSSIDDDANVGGMGRSETAVGIAHSEYAEHLVRDEKGIVDFVEIPFEQLVHTPRVIEIRSYVPVILHCASLSIAGDLSPNEEMVEQLAHWIRKTETPWLGEHLAYVRADGVWREVAEHMAFTSLSEREAARDYPRAPFNVGYTVSPQFSEEVIERVIFAAEHWRQRLGLPVLLENGPIYFEMPGSTMSQITAISEICKRAASIPLLLDLAHLVVTCANGQIDPYAALDALPLERVVEVHISGAREQSGLFWDDHTESAPPIVFELLERLLRRERPRAVTLEYNWDASFPRDVLRHDVERVRQILKGTHTRPL